MVRVVPCPSRLATSTMPRSAVTLRRTTSIPTPRPDSSVTLSAVEKPGRKISSWISRSLSDCASPTRPRSSARARIRARSRPAPSSATCTTSLARLVVGPQGDGGDRVLAAALRRAVAARRRGRAALRIMWVRGSRSCSTTARSASTSSPSTTRRACLPRTSKRREPCARAAGSSGREAPSAPA